MHGHNLRAHAWIVVAVVLVVIAAHAALFGLLARSDFSLALLAGVAGIAALKFAWWKFRR
jgi:hypothetical protein